MKHRLLLLIAVLLIIPNIVRADSLEISCPKAVPNNYEFSCNIYCNTVKGVTDISTQIVLSDNLSYVTFDKESYFEGEVRSLEINFYGQKSFVGNFKIGALKLRSKALGTGTVSLKNTLLYNGMDEDTSLEEKVFSNTINIEKSTEVVTEKKIKKNQKKTNQGTVNKNNNGNNQVVEEKKEEVPEKKEENTEDEIDFTKGAYLSNLKIEGYDIDFRSNVFNYNLKIKNENELVITPTVGNDKVTYKIIGNEDLKDGSVITIETIYDEEKINNYYINISKEQKKTKKEKKLNFTIILIIIIVLLVLINVIRMFISRKNKQDVDND